MENQSSLIGKSTLGSLIALGIPVIIEEILSTLMQYVDTAMVGRLGEMATASVSLTSSIGWLTNSVFSAFAIAFMAMISKAYGEKDNEKIKRLSRLASIYTLYSALIVMTISLLSARHIPVWMHAESSIHRNASAYYVIITLPMLFRAGSRIFSSAIRATKDTLSPMLINGVSNLLNVVLNWVFIYRLGYGVIGAALASAISFTVCGSAMYIRFRAISLFRYARRTALVKSENREFLRISLPALGTTLTSCFGYVFFASIVSSMGTTIFASHSIAIQAEEFFYIPGYGLRSATQSLIGISNGEKNEARFNEVKKYSIILTVSIMALNGAFLYFIARPLMSIFTVSSAVIDLGSQMLKIVAFTEPFFGMMIVMEGIYWGLGKTRYTFIVETLSMWLVRILSAAIIVNVFNGTLREVWYSMVMDNITKALLLTLPMAFKRGPRLEIEREAKG